jgi:hypothetical protein
MSSERMKEPDDKKAFTRRGLLQWSIPVILAVSLPAQVSAAPSGHHDSHNDHEDHGDNHNDGDSGSAHAGRRRN